MSLNKKNLPRVVTKIPEPPWTRLVPNRLSTNDPERSKGGFRKLAIYREILVIVVNVAILKMTK